MELHALLHHRQGAARPRAAETTAYGVAVLCWLLSAGVYIAAKFALPDFPPWTLAFWRPLLAGLILLPLVAQSVAPMARLVRARGLEVLVVGGLGLAISQGCIYAGLRDTTALNAGLIMALTPILTMLLARLLLGEPLGAWQVIGSLVALLGMCVIIFRGNPDAVQRLDLSIGDLWIVASACCFAGYSVLLRRAKFDLPRLPLLVLLLGAGAVAATPFYALELWRGAQARLDPDGLLALAYLVVPGGAVMYYLFNWTVDVFGAGKAGVFLYLQTVFVAVLAWALLGERLQTFHYEGGALIVVGVLLVTLLKARRPA